MLLLQQMMFSSMYNAHVILLVNWCKEGLSQENIHKLLTVCLLLIMLGLEIAIAAIVIGRWIRHKDASSKRRAVLSKGTVITGIVIGLLLIFPGVYLYIELQKCILHVTPETRPLNIALLSIFAKT